jgi:hypothetical protein
MAATLGRSFQCATLTHLKSDFSNDFWPLRRLFFERMAQKKGLDDVGDEGKRQPAANHSQVKAASTEEGENVNIPI